MPTNNQSAQLFQIHSRTTNHPPAPHLQYKDLFVRAPFQHSSFFFFAFSFTFQFSSVILNIEQNNNISVIILLFLFFFLNVYYLNSMSSSTSKKKHKQKSNAASAPPGNTGTHIPPPNAYLLSQLTRANYLTSRRHPFAETSDTFATELQRHVHFEGSRPPNRRILLFLRLLTCYPPNPDILSDLITLLEFENVHICRLAHYHIRTLAPIHDPDAYHSLIHVLQRQAASPSPARRACATKTFVKIFHTSDVPIATDFVMDVFNHIGGARVKKPILPDKQKRIGGIPIGEKNTKKEQQPTRIDKFKQQTRATFTPKIVRSEVYDYRKETTTEQDSEQSQQQQRTNKFKRNQQVAMLDDGTGTNIQASYAANAHFIRSKTGKMLVVHSTLAALRRINRVATESARIESYIFDSALMSIVPGCVRHAMALLELRCTVSPKAVSNYLAPRLPHKNPPADLKLLLEDIGARVYYARLLSILAEDPNLSIYIPNETSNNNGGGGVGGDKNKMKTEKKNGKRGEARRNLGDEMSGKSISEKASHLFKFLFNKEQVSNVISNVKERTLVVTNSVTSTWQQQQQALLKRRQLPPKDDRLGLEFAEALISLVKNASNRVLIEALRGLSRRRWTTWFEVPIPQSALYNAPELLDDNDVAGGGDREHELWAGDDEDDDEEEEDDDDENELGAYEDDLATGGGGINDDDNNDNNQSGKDNMNIDGTEPRLSERGRRDTSEKETWFSKIQMRRKERRDIRISARAPLFLRQVQNGMVPALEIILRRINVGLLNDEPVHRFSAVDAVIVLARAKIYGHTAEEQETFHQARSTFQNLRITAGPSSSAEMFSPSSSSSSQQQQPLQALVKPLVELVDEDPNPFIRGRAAVALLFVVASGAGRDVVMKELNEKSHDGNMEQNDNDEDDDESNNNKNNKDEHSKILLRLLGNYVRHPGSGSGVGLRQMSQVMDYLVYEILDVSPDLCSGAVALAEEWACAHATVGVCGRLGSIWEKVLSLGHGKLVGDSLLRSISHGPSLERVSSAAVIFLRRRTLDVAILTVGIHHVGNMSNGVGGFSLPEPLPMKVGVEIERYFSTLWHCILIGPSAECRAFAVESLAGAAVLAGEPFRIATYERLVELVRVGGFGVTATAQRVLTCMDVLYACREEFSETRAKFKIPRDGSYVAKQWLDTVWTLRCKAVTAAQIVLGVAPPPGWQPLGPSAARDVLNAERVNASQNTESGRQVNDDEDMMEEKKEANMEDGQKQTQAQRNGTGVGTVTEFNLPPLVGFGNMDEMEHDDNRNDNVNMDREREIYREDRERYNNDRNEPASSSGHRDRYRDDYDRRDDYYNRNDDDDDNYDRYNNDYSNNNDDHYHYHDRNHNDYEYNNEQQRRKNRQQQEQEEEDRRLAQQLQHEENNSGGVGGGRRHRRRRAGEDEVDGGDDEDNIFGSDTQGNKRSSAQLAANHVAADAKDMLSSTAQAAEKLFKQGLRGGKDLTEKVKKTAARSAALDKLRSKRFN